MSEKYLISILTDKTSWMNKYNVFLKNALEALGHNVLCVSKPEELPEGDIAFFLSCFNIVTKEFLAKNKHNIVVHASDLPKGKGWSPMTWQILEGKNHIPVTLFEASEKCDAGDIYLKDSITLNGDELIDEWQDLLGNKIVEMCINFVKNYENLAPIPQTGEESFYNRRLPKDSELDINKTIKEQFNLLRVVDNERYPAYFVYRNKKYILRISGGAILVKATNIVFYLFKYIVSICIERIGQLYMLFSINNLKHKALSNA